MKKLVSMPIMIVTLLCLIISANAETKSIGISDANGWFGQKVETVGKTIEDFGYKASADNKTGILSDIAWEFTNNSAAPYSVVAWFNTEGRDVIRFTFKYHKDAALFKQLHQSLTLLLGEPEYQDYSEEIKDGYKVINFETLTWSGGGRLYAIGFSDKSDGSRGTLKNAEDGTSGFVLTMIQYENEDKKEEPTSKPTATPKPKPTATPRPVNVEVSVDSVDIKETRYGTREFYIRFKNNANSTIDRIDFYVQGYNRYGERIIQYNIDTVSFYYDDEIKPGKLSPKNIYYNHYMLNEATKIKIAIVKYHTVDGRTIEVPESQLRWSTFEK